MRKTTQFLIGIALAIVMLAVAHGLWLPWFGQHLVSTQNPEKADAALVLAGDGHGHRILRAAELVRSGLVPKVIVSGPAGMYGMYECDLAIAYALTRGFPKEYFIAYQNQSTSTREEAQMAGPLLRKLKIGRLLLVTSDYHTRRAEGVYRKLYPDLKIWTVAAPDEYFDAAAWWKERESAKRTVLEWVKLVAYWFGI